MEYYFITIVRDGYALYVTTHSLSNIKAENQLIVHTSKLPHSSTIGIIPPKNADKFFIKEGRIKHLKIKLMK